MTRTLPLAALALATALLLGAAPGSAAPELHLPGIATAEVCIEAWQELAGDCSPCTTLGTLLADRGLGQPLVCAE